MSLLDNLENRIASLVEGTFSRMFRSEVRPVELARKLTREMEEHRSHSLSRTYVPNEYKVWLSSRDHERFRDYEEALAAELSGYLLEHARREGYSLLSSPEITFATDDRLGLGEFGIQTRTVSPEGPGRSGRVAGRPAPADDEEFDADDGFAAGSEASGRTMVYSTAARISEPLREVAAVRQRRAALLHDGRRLVVGAGGVTVGRSRECDIVLDDPNVSRRHAEVRPRGGSWILSDLGSTNGTLLNRRPIQGAETLSSGDEIEIGTSLILFEVDA